MVDAASKTIIPLDPQGPGEVVMRPTGFIKPEWVDEGAANEKGHVFYTNPETDVQVGFWECSPFKETIVFPYDELGVVLGGALELIDETGQAKTYRPGEMFFIPRGATITWHIIEHFKQYYMIYAPVETQYFRFQSHEEWVGE